MRFTQLRRMLILAGLCGGFAATSVAAPIGNSATGSFNGNALNQATVNLNRTGAAVTSLTAEVSPNDVMSGRNYRFDYDLLPEINPGDSGLQSIEVNIPGGYGNVSVAAVSLGGIALVSACPASAAGEYCASLSGNVLSVDLGSAVTSSLTNVRIRFDADTPPATGSGDFTSAVTNGATPQAAVAGDADGDPSDSNSMTVEVTLSQGLLLELVKAANKTEATVGEVVAYAVSVGNTVDHDVIDVKIEDLVPPNFKYVKGSARLDGAPTTEPSGNRPLVFEIGTVPALIDENGNGRADPGEQGYVTLSYQLVIGSGARPGTYRNTAVAKDYCDACLISNEDEAVVEVTLDPVMDLGTIIGKVYQDGNRNGWQDEGELGVPNAMVALDDGTYALTDQHGKYHFPAVRPGQRMVKINMLSLPPGTQPASSVSEIVQITPGLMVPVNFGVAVPRELETIGRPATPATRVAGEGGTAPVEIQGSAETLDALINGDPVELPTGDVRLGVEKLEESVVIRGSRLEPVVFELTTDPTEDVEAWMLTITDGRGGLVGSREGRGRPPGTVTWDGNDGGLNTIEAGAIYQYQLAIKFADGTQSTSARRLFGVNRTSVIALNLMGEAFEIGQARLSLKAKQVLREAAEILRQVPDEKVVIEGHTDSVGTWEANLDLSRRRAESAAAYLVDDLGLPEAQFALRWYGEERPVAPNDLPDGRALNRRVEIRGEVEQTDSVRLLRSYRTTPEVRINGGSIEVGPHGRFRAVAEPNERGALDLRLADSVGRTVATTIPVPDLELEMPAEGWLVPQGGSAGACRTLGTTNEQGQALTTTCRLAGRTQPGNAIELDGRPVETRTDGSFDVEVELQPGSNPFALLARNPQGYTRFANLTLTLEDRDASGNRFVVADAIPNLTLNLPPSGMRLTTPDLFLAGVTDPGNTVLANGLPLTVAPDGSVTGNVELERGDARLVIHVEDQDGRIGSIERDYTVAKHELFLMAFADGKFGRLKGKGFIEGAGLDQQEEYYTEGRVALYLKGTIAGKYLITSKFDSGLENSGPLFDGLSAEESNVLLTNLDPDKLYPVYGDSSTVVFDAQSQGKLYLAVDSQTIHALIGNYSLSLTDTELTNYRRTLHGARFAYQSASRTEYGRPDTEIIVFGAESRQVHTQDQLRATGGSLYYLSHRDIVMGSEEITIVVRDKNTGLQLSEERQRRNVDYTIKYPEGRLMFHRPIASVVQGGTLVNREILDGQHVYIYADYERRVEGFEKTATGGRLRQQIGDHVAVGGTYVKDDRDAGSYELQGLDAELRLGKGTRLIAEAADSSGTESTVFVSPDGGLTYNEVAAGVAREGTAWKAAAELDVGEWFNKPDRHRVRVYFRDVDSGFSSSGSLMDQGRQKMGVNADLELTGSDALHFGFDVEERDAAAALQTGGKTKTRSLAWRHTTARWGAAVEYFGIDQDSGTGSLASSSELGAASYWVKPHEKLTARIERQQTFSGPTNDQTTVGLDYQALPSLALALVGTDGNRGRSGQAGVIFTNGESELYLTERVANDQAGKTASTIVGARSPLGPTSKVYTEYQREDGTRGERALRVLGYQRQWDIGPRFRFTLNSELADVASSAGSSDRSSVAAGLSYAGAEHWKLYSRQEVRVENGDERRLQYFTANQVDFRLNTDFTLLLRYRYSKTLDRDTGESDALFDERVFGLAYRPVGNDRFNSLMRYTRLTDERPISVASIEGSERTMDVFSVDTAYRITPRLEWLAKAAMKRQEESFESMPTAQTQTYLAIQRLNYTAWRRLDLALEYRSLIQAQSEDQRDGWLSEAAWELLQNFRLGVGYNFTDFSDDEFSDNDYSVEGWFFRLQGRY